MMTLIALPWDPCSSVLDPGCVQTVDNDDHPWGPPMPDIPGEIGSNALEDAAKAFQSAVGWLISHTASWWVRTSSPNLQSEAAIGYLQLLVRPLTIAVAVLALLMVAARMALTRKAVPAVDAGRGLVVLAAVTAIGTVLPNLLLQWGDQWCRWVLDASSQGDFAKRMAEIVIIPTGTPAALVLVLCLAALVIGIVQALLLLFRGAALIILAGLLPLAAAGGLTAATRSWLTRVGGWMLALIFYKPAAAAVYATAFTLIGSGKSLHSVLMGFAMMLISLIAFPVLLKFFTWTTGGAESGSGGGILGALMGGATALGAMRAYGAANGSAGGGRGAAGEHADYLSQQLGDQNIAPSGDQPAAQPPTDPAPAPSDHQAAAGSPQAPGGDPSAPSGGTPPDTGQFATTENAAGSSNGHGWAPPDGGHGDPVGPATVQTFERERHRGQDTLRWMGNPTGSADTGNGGPSGAVGEGGGGGGA
ncbi:hypothetical protein GCM10009527_095760 [Actinomadura nitritigenes]|uniref:Type IV secretion system protein n=1 Tax=Actinomadura nitritigenes TaxID=134602 RepID=A0ABS3R212_9ACTN|nr:hypothetical protein [Actinomadura nitritigenes]MBO2440280.1 hypothetical protein [Actinomadura nitritigenes]